MHTTINGKDAEWTPEIRAKWNAATEGRPDGTVSHSNYYTPRPYRNKYDRGSTDTGFCYIVGRHVYTVTLQERAELPDAESWKPKV